MHWWLPLKGSTFAGEVDGLFLAITIITGIAFVLVEVGLIWFVVKYRQRPGQKAFYTHGNTRAEVIWTTIPAVTMVALGLISNHYWVKIKGRHSVPANAYPIAIHAKQFEWQVTYPGADGQLGTSDDFTVRNQLHVPVGRPVVVHLSSEDVIHSFFVPVFRVKQDAVPGMDIKAWLGDRAGSVRAGLCRAVRHGPLPHARPGVRAYARGIRRVDETGGSGGKAMTSVAATTRVPHAHHDDRSFLRKYIFSTDHKIIGIQFLFVSLFFLLLGGVLAMQMRWQVGFPGKPMPGGGLLPESMAAGGVILPEYYVQLVSMHGTFMVFFAIMPLLVGVYANFLIPLKIGTHDMAFPRINMASFWAAFAAGLLMFASLFVPEGGIRSGWTNYAPLSARPDLSGVTMGQQLWCICIGVRGLARVLGPVDYCSA